MIRRSVSAAFLLRDGFTGRPVAPASVLCAVDGYSVRPMMKSDGYLVVTDLEPGEHLLSLRCFGYREEAVPLTVPAKGTAEGEIDLTPGAGYRFPPDTARLRLTVPGAPGEELWAAYPGRVKLKLAQKKKAGKDTVIRVFCAGDPARLPVPGTFLTIDETNPEVVRFLSVREEAGQLAAPLGKDHNRGVELRPARRFRTDGEGTVELLFPQGGEIHLFFRDQLKKTKLMPGDQTLLWEDLS